MAKAAFCVVYSTAPDKRTALSVSESLLNKRLAACVNIFKIDSRYWWKGKLEKANEYAMLFKTKKALFPKLTRELKKVHPYEVPAVVAWMIEAGNADYLRWIGEETE